MNLDTDYVSLRQASEMLGVSLKTVQLWVETGVLLSWKTDGEHNRILQSSIALILEERLKVEKDRPKQKAVSGCIKIVVVEDDPDLLRLLQITFDDYPVPIDLRSAKNGFVPNAMEIESNIDIMEQRCDPVTIGSMLETEINSQLTNQQELQQEH
jgi:excisionase family DNA binding protein